MHRVVTTDGYILEVHRITGKKDSVDRGGKKHRILSSTRLRTSRFASSKLKPKPKPVVFLQHGFVDSSATWVMSGPDHGFGMCLKFLFFFKFSEYFPVLRCEIIHSTKKRQLTLNIV